MLDQMTITGLSTGRHKNVNIDKENSIIQSKFLTLNLNLLFVFIDASSFCK